MLRPTRGVSARTRRVYLGRGRRCDESRWGPFFYGRRDRALERGELYRRCIFAFGVRVVECYCEPSLYFTTRQRKTQRAGSECSLAAGVDTLHPHEFTVFNRPVSRGRPPARLRSTPARLSILLQLPTISSTSDPLRESYKRANSLLLPAL